MSLDQTLLNQYCQGEGVFAGQNPQRQHCWAYAHKPDNFYRITSVVPAESADYVLADSEIFESTKYYPILLKEWFYAVKVGGFIVVPIVSQEGAKKISDLVSGFYPKNALEIVVQGKGGDESFFVIGKRLPALAAGDNIDSWTFGVITNGKRNKAMEKIIQSIHQQQVPNYEIIVCGTYFNRKEKNYRYIHFTEHDDKGWLSKKKNIIAEAAKYENLVIVHDRMVFQPGWYEGMKQWGNYFDALSCITLLKRFNTYLRAFDWFVHDDRTIKAPPVRSPFLRAGSSKGVPRPEMALHYDDWDTRVAMCGSMAILKRLIWKIVPWDEKLFWVNYEDVNISHRITEAGGVIRFNPFSECETLFWGHCLISVAKRDLKKLSQEFEPDSLPHVFYNFKYYTRLRWKHFKQSVKKVLESKKFNWLVSVIKTLKKKAAKFEKK